MNVFKLVRTSTTKPPSNFVSADPVTVSTAVGGTLTLPSTVEGQYSDGYYKETPVSGWNTSTANLSQPGVYTVYGTIGDNPKAASAIVTVKPGQPQNYVSNPGLESGSTGWTSSNPSVAAPATGGSITPHTGSGDIHYWSGAAFSNDTVYQTLTGLPNGTYTLSVWGEGSASGSAVPFLYATGYSATDPTATETQKFTPSGWNVWKQYRIPVTVTSGQVTISVNFNGAAGDWGDADDFYFGLPPVSSTAIQTQAAANTELKVYAVAPGFSQSTVTTYHLTTNDTTPSSWVQNGGFNQQGVLSPWTLSGVTEGTDNATYAFDATQDSTPGVVYEGAGQFKYWAAKNYTFTLSQKVTGLSNGVYTLSAEPAGGNNMVLNSVGRATNDPGIATIQLSAETPLGTKSKNVINEGTAENGWNQWNQFSVNDIYVTDGTCTISFTVSGSPNYWGYLDDVKLVKVSDLSPADFKLGNDQPQN